MSDTLADTYKSIKDEITENMIVDGLSVSMSTTNNILKHNAIDYIKRYPKQGLSKFYKKAGPVGLGAGILLDAYQGRNNDVFGKKDTIGTRAVNVTSSIANGLTLGMFNLNSDKNVKNMYNFYSNVFNKK